MTQNILDDNFESREINQISDRVLCEIKLSQKKYPENVIKIVNQEISSRNLVISNFLSEGNFELKISASKWIKNNKNLSILTLIVVVSSISVGTILTGLITSLTVLISVYISIEVNQVSRKIKWRKANLLITILILATIVLTFIINKYAV